MFLEYLFWAHIGGWSVFVTTFELLWVKIYSDLFDVATLPIFTYADYVANWPESKPLKPRWA